MFFYPLAILMPFYHVIIYNNIQSLSRHRRVCIFSQRQSCAREQIWASSGSVSHFCSRRRLHLFRGPARGTSPVASCRSIAWGEWMAYYGKNGVGKNEDKESEEREKWEGVLICRTLEEREEIKRKWRQAEYAQVEWSCSDSWTLQKKCTYK